MWPVVVRTGKHDRTDLMSHCAVGLSSRNARGSVLVTCFQAACSECKVEPQSGWGNMYCSRCGHADGMIAATWSLAAAKENLALKLK